MGGGGGDAESTGNLPWWAEGAHRSLINKAENFAYGDRGSYVPYGDERIAGLTPQELQAQAARESIYNRGDVAGQFASNQLGLAAGLAPEIAEYARSTFTTDEMNQRMSPFMEGVIQPQLREARLEFDQQLNRSQAGSIARGGSIGAYRSGLADNQLRSLKAQTLGDIRGMGQQRAYDQALQSFNLDRDVGISGLGQALGAHTGIAAGADTLGTNSMARELQLISELDRSGAIQREFTQREMDLAYSDFTTERDFPMQRMNFLSSILTGLPSQALAGQTINSANPGLAAQLASLGLGAAGISQLFGGS